MDARPPDTPPIERPTSSCLEQFKSKRGPLIAGVATLQTALPIYKLSDAGDWARLHPDKVAYWSDELCFVMVPILGQKDGQLHLISEELAMAFLPSKKIERFALALAAKPNDVFFLCRIPTRNLDNRYNATNLEGCEEARKHWTQLTSRKAEGVDEYQISYAINKKAFPETKWPGTPLDKLIEISLANRMIFDEQHPGLKRLRGDVVL